jgi:hypothetical protein
MYFSPLQTAFGSGTLYPFSLLIVPRKGDRVLGETFFNRVGPTLTRFIDAVPHTTSEDLRGIVFQNGGPVPWVLLHKALNKSEPLFYNSEFGRMARLGRARYVTADWTSATYVCVLVVMYRGCMSMYVYAWHVKHS